MLLGQDSPRRQSLHSPHSPAWRLPLCWTLGYIWYNYCLTFPDTYMISAFSFLLVQFTVHNGYIIMGTWYMYIEIYPFFSLVL